MEPRISIITLGVSSLERSCAFYKEGLGLPTTHTPDSGIIFFQTSGVCLALYPMDQLAADVGLEAVAHLGKEQVFSGITLAHNTRTKAEVDQLLARAESAGGRIVKQAQPTSWGGYSGYFSDPDGYLWEVAHADSWAFNPDGSLVIP